MKIILTVSGGVDSVAMLHSLVKTDDFAKIKFSQIKYVVAHFNHGMRTDSDADERFVRELAQYYQLGYESESVNLGTNANESVARKARWYFLTKVKNKHKADFIATAHHADDIFETQLINILRGSGRRGVSVLRDTDKIIRPLISRTKSEIYQYALSNKLEFAEDSTNQDTNFLRNKLRLSIIPKLGTAKTDLESYFFRINKLNPEIDEVVNSILNALILQANKNISIKRTDFNMLHASVKQELLREVLNRIDVIHDKQKVSAAMIKRLCSFASRKDSNRSMHISKFLHAYISKENLVLEIQK